mgnify:CR=1 FL=1|jgi:hypothetical protein
MAFPKKHEQSVIHSVRIPKDLKEFLKNNFKNRDGFTANDFINLLIENSEEYKKFLARKAADDKEPKLFA